MTATADHRSPIVGELLAAARVERRGARWAVATEGRGGGEVQACTLTAAQAWTLVYALEADDHGDRYGWTRSRSRSQTLEAKGLIRHVRDTGVGYKFELTSRGQATAECLKAELQP